LRRCGCRFLAEESYYSRITKIEVGQWRKKKNVRQGGGGRREVEGGGRRGKKEEGGHVEKRWGEEAGEGRRREFEQRWREAKVFLISRRNLLSTKISTTSAHRSLAKT
jgi:hypothetical protein